ncbi:SPOR domain-containing protein [Shinella sp. BYT-45]|uniref:SPOR domain-containing protein n=1 Tax=Shinella sp. BYT-45 TaxID=3377377 RepID=UPI00397EFAED
MADKNFARSGTADTGLLADDDPLSELARLVNFDPRPVQEVGKSYPDAVQATPRHENPVLALEDELLRAFEQYDAPSPVAVDPVDAEEPAPRHVEPVFEEPAPVLEDRAAIIDEVPTRDTVAGEPHHREPSFEAVEPSFAEEPFTDRQAGEPEPELDADPALLLADELETAIAEVPSVEVEQPVHAGHAFADRLEPRFEEPVRHEPAAEPPVAETSHDAEPQPAFLGLQPLTADEGSVDDIGLDLERELELSIGDGLVADPVDVHPGEEVADASFVEPLPVAVETVEANIEPNFDGWMPADGGVEHAEPFRAEPLYAGDEPHFVAEMPFETREDRALAAVQAEMLWQAEAVKPVLEAEPAYQVESVEKGRDYDHDALLAEVERFPVPESRSPLYAAAAAVSRSTPANISAIFGRATPTVHREPVMEKAASPSVEPVKEEAAEAVQEPVVEARHEEAARPSPAASEPDLDFENMEFDLSDIDLDLSDFSLDEEPVEEVKAEAARPAEVETPVRREPAVAVPVSTYTKPQAVAAEANDGALPFDPAMIAETDEGVSPVTELDVPQLPAVEKEKPPVYQPDYDFDIDAEMAQLFNEPAAKQRTEDLQAGVAVGAVAAASAAQPVAQINDVDDFERALEEDFRRSLNQPERMAIPVDPGQASVLYSGDGYDEEPARPRRGMLIAASIAGLLLVGGGGVYAWSTFTGGSAASGEPRVILADKEPVKIVPEERGGKTVPNQDKAVYDRVAGDTASTPQQEQLVTSTEEPVDVVQRTLTPETLPFDGPEDGAGTADAADDENRLLPGVDEPETAVAETGNRPLVSPRKVKTMIVKPDGTLVAREETVSGPATETAGLDAKATATTGRASGEVAATANATIDGEASLRTEQAAAEGQPRSALAEVADAEVDDTAPVRTVKTTTIGAADTAAAGGNNMPVPETRPIDQPVTVVGTVTENGNVRGGETADAGQAGQGGQQTAEQTQVAAVTPGSYVIQIASLPSEAEAQKSYNSLSAKFASVIGGRGVDIKKAEIPNKGTYFRVRIPAGSREEANALCNRYKSAGGSCLVTR